MSFFSPDYETPGAGVPENEPQKPGPIRYFIVSGRKFWDMVVLNLLYFLFSLPAIAIYTLIGLLFLGNAGDAVGGALAAEGMTDIQILELKAAVHIVLSVGFGFLITALLGSGAPRAGLSFVLRNYSREEHAFLWSDFLENTKKNLGKGTVIFLIDVLFTFIICLDIASYGGAGTFWGLIASYIALFIFIIYILMHPYIYMILVTFGLKLKAAYKNAFMLTAVKIFQNAGCLVLAVVMTLVILELANRWPVLMFLLLMAVFSFPCLILDMNSFSVVKKYMIEENNDD